MVEDNRAKFPFNDGEVERRKEFVGGSRKIVKEMKDSVTGRQAVAKIDSDKRLALGTGSGAGSAAWRAASEEENARIAGDNQDFLDNQCQEQRHIIRQQDYSLTMLSASTQNLLDIGQKINTELQVHKDMLDDLENGIDRESEKLNFFMKRMGRLLKTGDNKQLRIIMTLFVLAVVLVFLVINV